MHQVAGGFSIGTAQQKPTDILPSIVADMPRDLGGEVHHPELLFF